MSRIGKQIIKIPSGVTVSYDAGVFTVKGPKGELKKNFKDDIAINIATEEITLAPKEGAIGAKALWGTYASHIKNMIEGVTNMFSKKLILEGVGYKSDVAGKNLNLALGFSHPVVVEIPETITVTAEKNIITVSGIDKELVGSFTASLRALKKPEPYKGKGFRYEDEVIRRKQGKKTA